MRRSCLPSLRPDSCSCWIPRSGCVSTWKGTGVLSPYRRVAGQAGRNLDLTEKFERGKPSWGDGARLRRLPRPRPLPRPASRPSASTHDQVKSTREPRRLLHSALSGSRLSSILRRRGPPRPEPRLFIERRSYAAGALRRGADLVPNAVDGEPRARLELTSCDAERPAATCGGALVVSRARRIR